MWLRFYKTLLKQTNKQKYIGILFSVLGLYLFFFQYSAKLNFSFDLEFKICFVALVLMFFNWFLEAYKFRFIFSNTFNTTISQINAFDSTLVGVFVGVLSGIRLFDFIGRKLALSQVRFSTVLKTSLYSSYFQTLPTFLFGGIALLLYFNFSFYWSCLLLIPIAVFSAVLNLKFSFEYVFQLKLFFLSTFRYSLFLLMYSLFYFYLGGNKADFFSFLILVCLSFLCLHFIPVSFAGKLGLREWVLLSISSFGFFEESLVLQISFYVWVFNVMLPALLGGVFYLTKQIKL